MGSIFALVVSSHVFVDTLNIYAFKKIYDKGDSILIGVNISPYILVFKRNEKGFSGGIRIDFSAKLEDGKDYFIRFFKRIEYENYEDTRKKDKKIRFKKWIKINGTVKEVEIMIKDLNSQKEWNFKDRFLINDVVETGSFLFLRKKDGRIEYLLPPLKDTNITVLFTFKNKSKTDIEVAARDENNTFYKLSKSFDRGLHNVLFDLNIKKIEEDKLRFTVKFKTDRKSVRLEKEIYIKPIDIFVVYKWKDILNALNIIFPRSDLEVLYKAKPEERKKVWNKFWKRYDPDPVTPYNELEIEFLERFQYVMKNFSGPLKGYRTDRGRIYIKYGPPDYIEDHPYEWGTYPYQIWYYANLGKRFLFVDKTGFGDYELATDLRDIYPQYR